MKVDHPGQRTALAAVVATALHLLVIWVISGDGDERHLPIPTELSASVREASPVPVATTQVRLINEVPAGLFLPRISGAGDAVDFGDQHPFPAAAVDFPGSRAASRGGGDVGGSETYAAERYREDARAELWNDPHRYRTPRQREYARAGTEESVARAQVAGFANRAQPRTTRARAGEARGRVGAARGNQADGNAGELAPVLADPEAVLGAAPAQRRHQRVAAALTPAAEALARRGHGVDSDRRGPVSDRDNVAAASSELDPLPIEVTSARDGGDLDGWGVAGEPAPGVVSRGWSRDGTAATTARVGRGNDRGAIAARRDNPYFRAMYRRLDEVIVFPRHLAVAMEQGEVVASFTLYADGHIDDLQVRKSSGFDDFDRELHRAIKRVAPFGPVPEAVLRGRGQIKVITPYAFRNPVIR